MRINQFITFALACCMLFACTRVHQTRYLDVSNFVGDYSLLTEGEDGDALLSYWKKDVNWWAYKKAILKPVVIKNIIASELNGISHAERYRLMELLEFRLQESLKTRFRLVNKPDEDTVVVEFAITDAKTSDALVDMFSSVYPAVRNLAALKHRVFGAETIAGKASIEGKILDSMTGDLLMASADSRVGGKTLIGLIYEWADIEKAYRYWAAQVGFQLCIRQGGKLCQQPVSFENL
jgi:Protein of unknown function (DUF3313)